MEPRDLFQLFTAPLEAMGIRYMVTGSVASLVYGEPRLTHDIDLVVELERSDAERLEDAFPAAEFYCPPVEVIRMEQRRRERGHFNLIHHASGFKADVYLKSTGALHAWAFERRRRAELAAGGLWLAPPEYVITRKLEYFREGGSEKHLRDIRAVLAELSDEGLDREALAGWVERLGLQVEWARVSGGLGG